MRPKTCLFQLAFCLTVLLGLSAKAKAGIVLDYSHDMTQGTNFFGTNATAKAALEAAVNDINNVLNLNGNLSGISMAQNSVTGTSGSTSATLDFGLSYTNPVTGAAEFLTSFELATDEIVIYVGMRNLTGTTLGQGGLGSIGASAGFPSGGFPSEWEDAVDDLEAKANTIYGRGLGGPSSVTPHATTTAGTFTLGGNAQSFSIDNGVTHGNLWFDSDTNNDSVFDSAGELDAFWHFDHTSAVDPLKFDFYSVALHEVLHAIGYGTADSWDALVQETAGVGTPDNWLGSNVIALKGSGNGLIDDGGAHVASGQQGTDIVNGTMQDSVMTPSITNGDRKYLTDLDIAFLQDFGFANAAAVPEPSSWLLISVAGAGFVFYRIRRKRVTAALAA